MDARQYRRMEEIFSRCCDMPQADREAFLEEACGDDAELRKAVENLLRHDNSGESVMRRGRAGAMVVAADTVLDDDGDLPDSIGPYKVVRRLGAGGMGVVYLAEQDRPRRAVAVKVLNPALISADILRRFEREAQVLGQLRHPGIAHIYDAGTIGQGRDRLSYFAMEYVDGVPLNKYVGVRKPGTRGTLALVARVCDAVHHAHQKGVIHRDLKPGNILVDATGQPKVLDFGVARATDGDIQTVTLQTDVGQLIGTVPYMSPEQVTGVSTDIDTRSDVYALGVITFELLAGKLPHAVRDRSIPEAARMIREDDPAALSSINPMFRGDIETIVAKALAKERDRRYVSAAEFAADIHRYLADEPIIARPASTTYQLRKFARRNRALVGGACATFLAVVVGLVASLVLYVKAERAREAEKEQSRVARAEADRANAINDFLLQDMLAAPDPWSERGKDVTVASILDDAATRVDEAFDGQPLTEAQVRFTLGGSFMARGLYDKAAEQLRQSVDLYGDSGIQDDEALFAALERYAEALRAAGRLEQAESQAHAALAMAEDTFTEGDARMGDAMYTLGQVQKTVGRFDDARATLERCLAIRGQLDPPDDEARAQALVALGSAVFLQKRYAEAEPVLHEAVELLTEIYGADHPYVALVQMDLAGIDQESGRPADAKAHLLPACRALHERLGDEHAETLSCRRTLALARHGTGESDTGLEELADILTIYERTLGRDHPETLIAVNHLAFVHLERNELDDAARLYRRLLANARDKLGAEHADTLRYASNLAWTERKRGRLDEAETLFRSAAETYLDHYGIEYQSTQVACHSLALLMQERASWEDCFANFKIITDACRSDEIDCGWRRGYYLNGFGDALVQAGRYEQAVPVLEECVDVCAKMFAEDDWRLADTRGKLGYVFSQLGRRKEAEVFLTDTYPIVLAAKAAPPATKRLAYERLREGLEDIGRADRLAEFGPPDP